MKQLFTQLKKMTGIVKMAFLISISFAATDSFAQIVIPNTNCLLAVKTDGGSSVQFLGVTYTTVGLDVKSTFAYKVTSGCSPNISHFIFGNFNCLSCMSSKSNYFSTSPSSPIEIGEDPTTGLCGIKYDFSVDCNQSTTVSFTLNGFYGVGLIKFGLKSGTNIEIGDICGPICTAPNLNLGDLVFYDINNNGIQDAGEPGIAGAKVNLYADANGDNIPDGTALATTTTSSTGIYAFTGLTAGKYILGVSLPAGYAQGATTSTSTDPNNNNNIDNNGVTLALSGTEVRSNFITLTAGGEPSNGGNSNLTLDFGFRGTASIGDFVFNDLNANGIQDANEPVLGGVTITLKNAAGATIATAITISTGAYSFANLAPGTYTVTFSTPTNFQASPAKQGGDVTKDSDPFGGVASVTLTAGQTNNTIDAGFFSTQKISGNVFDDADGLTNFDVNTTGTPGVANPKTNAGGLFANLLNDAGNVVATTPVTSGGTYSFTNVALGNYTVQLTTLVGTIGSAAPATQLPAGWVNTGEFGSTLPGNTAGSDGLVNGHSATIVVLTGDNKTEVNFGIERLPESMNLDNSVPNPATGTIFTLNSVSPFFFPILTGSDPEDMISEGVLTGKTVIITSLLTNPKTVLRYNGVNVAAGNTFTSFNPSLLTVFVLLGSIEANSTSFQYAYVDRAGKADPTPATYMITWPGNGSVVLPVKLTSFNALAKECSADITWVTASEINSSRFDVEVSSNSGLTYTRSTTVSATGSSSRSASYNSSYSMHSGVVYLVRLKIIDNDGSFTYSNTRKVSCANGYANITLAPNPVITSFMLRGMDDGKNQISIYASNGELMKTQVITNTQGSVDVSSFAGGKYNVRIVNQSGTVTTIQMFKN